MNIKLTIYYQITQTLKDGSEYFYSQTLTMIFIFRSCYEKFLNERMKFPFCVGLYEIL